MEPKRTHVLVVDDDRDVRRGLRRRLGAAGYAVSTASGGQDAVVKCERAAPDILILDIEMPDVDGFDVCEYIRSRYADRDIAVVFLTGTSDPLVRQNLGDMTDYVGGDYYVLKPYDPDLLLEVVHGFASSTGSVAPV